MSQPETSGPDHTASPALNLPLRLAALAAGSSIISLRQELDSRALIVFLTLVVFLGPYLLIALSPQHRGPAQLGFASGYALSMSAALIVYFVARSFEAATPAPIGAYKVGLLLNVVLLVIAVNSWIRWRKRLNNSSAFSMLVFGGCYPIFGFCLIAVLGHLFLDR
jgi:uncharacterized membrane protein (UPF0136 family)